MTRGMEAGVEEATNDETEADSEGDSDTQDGSAAECNREAQRQCSGLGMQALGGGGGTRSLRRN